MSTRTWLIIGATSIIAEKFAHIAAQNNHNLYLVGRDQEHLQLISEDIRLRYKVRCDIYVADLARAEQISKLMQQLPEEVDLLLAHSDFTLNEDLNSTSIPQLVTVNVLTSALLIDTYLKRQQNEYHIMYLSSVAACRGRAKNSLYGGSKAAIELYLEGLQQQASVNCHITIARLGFIDTRQTYGLAGIFYAAPADACAQACWNKLYANKRLFYYPKFWQLIMAIIRHLPFVIYKKMSAA